MISDANWGEQDKSHSFAAIDASLEAGITALDTAPGYGAGAAESLVGEALYGRREQVFIATKVPIPLTESAIRESLEGSLRRLRTDYVDLLQIHWPDRNTPISQTADVLLKLKEEGKIHAIGVCNFGPQDLIEAAALMPVTVNQMPYSLLWRGIEFELLPLCHKLGIHILAYSSLMQGLLSGKFHRASDVPEGRARTKHFSADGRPKIRHGEAGHEAATFNAVDSLRNVCAEIDTSMSVATLVALLTKPPVASVIAGARNAVQARENAEVLRTHLSPEATQRLFEATEGLKQEIGSELDPWFTPSRIR